MVRARLVALLACTLCILGAHSVLQAGPLVGHADAVA